MLQKTKFFIIKDNLNFQRDQTKKHSGGVRIFSAEQSLGCKRRGKEGGGGGAGITTPKVNGKYKY